MGRLLALQASDECSIITITLFPELTKNDSREQTRVTLPPPHTHTCACVHTLPQSKMYLSWSQAGGHGVGENLWTLVEGRRNWCWNIVRLKLYSKQLFKSWCLHWKMKQNKPPKTWKIILLPIWSMSRIIKLPVSLSSGSICTWWPSWKAFFSVLYDYRLKNMQIKQFKQQRGFSHEKGKQKWTVWRGFNNSSVIWDFNSFSPLNLSWSRMAPGTPAIPAVAESSFGIFPGSRIPQCMAVSHCRRDGENKVFQPSILLLRVNIWISQPTKKRIIPGQPFVGSVKQTLEVSVPKCAAWWKRLWLDHCPSSFVKQLLSVAWSKFFQYL